MIFNSIDFILFFAVFFIVFWLIPFKNLIAKNIWLLIGSYFFYSWLDWRFSLLLMTSSVINFIIGLKIKNASSERTKSYILYLGIFAGISALFIFKYYNFFLESFQSSLSHLGVSIHVSLLNLILPLGISFYTFRTLSYVIDIYKEKIEPSNSILIFLNYVSFFPSLISGPIDRADLLIPQLEQPTKFAASDFTDGSRQILWGLFKKIVIADNCLYFTNYAFDNYQTLNASTLLIGAILYAIQLYADFSGYSDMAIGVARLLGFKTTRNFAYPFFAENITEYWKRWHISLTSWVTEYVFTPLTIAFRDYGKLGLWGAVFFNFLAVGLWHGANWTFVFFGFLNALLYVPFVLKGKLTTKKKKHYPIVPEFSEALKIGGTFLLVAFTDIFFRSQSIHSAILYIKNMISLSIFSKPNFEVGNISKASLLFIPVLFFAEWVQRNKEHALCLDDVSSPIMRLTIYIFLILLIIMLGAFSNEIFIYFQF